MKLTRKYGWIVGMLLIWSIIFSVPSCRHLLRAAVAGSPWTEFTLLPNSPQKYPSKMEKPPLPIQVHTIRQSDQDFPVFAKKEALPQIDKLIAQHPDLPWLIATRLQITLGTYLGNRQGGEWSDSRTYEDIQKGPPSQEKRDREPNYTPQEMQHTLKLCRQGERLEPQNVFFSWMKMYFSMLNWQDDEAKKALHLAASKTYWNNHQAEFTQRYIKAVQDILKRPLMPYEKSSALLVDFSAQAKRREMARIIGWEGVKLKRVGNHDQALQLWADFAHSATIAAQGEDDIIDFLVDYALFSLATNGPTYPQREIEENSKKVTINDEKRIQNFVAYANKYHRPDLAQRISDDWQTNHALFTGVKSKVDSSKNLSMISWMEFGAALFSFSVILILSVLGALLAWGVLEFFHLFAKHNKSTFAATNSFSWKDYCKGIIACSGLPVFLLGIGFLLLLMYFITAFVPQDLQYDIIGGWGNISSFFSIPSETTLWEQTLFIFGNPGPMNSFPVFYQISIMLTPLVGGVFFTLIHGMNATNSPKSLWHKTRKWGFLMLLFTTWGIIAFITEYNLTQLIAATICALFLVISSAILLWKNRKQSRRWALLQSSLSGWIVTGSVLVMALFISQIALNKTLRPWADSSLRGEMHLIHDVKNTPQ